MLDLVFTKYNHLWYFMHKRTLFLILFGLLNAQALAQYSQNISIEPLLQTDTTSIGQPLFYPDVEQAEVTILKITIEPGNATGWHKHDIPIFAHILQGEFTVEREDGVRFQFTAGNTISEMIDTYHQGVNQGEEPVVMIAIYLGGDARPLTVRMEEEALERSHP